MTVLVRYIINRACWILTKRRKCCCFKVSATKYPKCTICGRHTDQRARSCMWRGDHMFRYPQTVYHFASAGRGISYSALLTARRVGRPDRLSARSGCPTSLPRSGWWWAASIYVMRPLVQVTATGHVTQCLAHDVWSCFVLSRLPSSCHKNDRHWLQWHVRPQLCRLEGWRLKSVFLRLY